VGIVALRAFPDARGLTRPGRLIQAPEPVRSTRTRPLIILALGCAVALAVLYLLFVRSRWGQEVDQAALDGSGINSARARGAASRLLATISIGSVASAAVALGLVAAMRRRLALVAVPLLTVGGAVVTAEILKHWAFIRPDLLDLPEYGNSFPSGHSTIACSLALSAVLVAPPRLRAGVAVLAALYAAAVGCATVAAGWHRPSDVVGGQLVASLSAAVVAALVLTLVPSEGSRLPDAPRARAGIPGGLGATGLGVAALGLAAAVIVSAARNGGPVDWSDPDTGFFGGMAAIVGCAALLVGLVVLALGAAGWDPAAPRARRPAVAVAGSPGA
jgi:membrane-associated phospholipid phosphatase